MAALDATGWPRAPAARRILVPALRLLSVARGPARQTQPDREPAPDALDARLPTSPGSLSRTKCALDEDLRAESELGPSDFLMRNSIYIKVRVTCL